MNVGGNNHMVDLVSNDEDVDNKHNNEENDTELDEYVTGDSEDDEDVDEYLQTKRLDSIASATQAKYAFLIIPSSAAAERVFSVLKHSLSLVQMHQALEDRTEIQVKMCYNHRQEKWHDTDQ